MIWLSGCDNPDVAHLRDHERLGLIVRPDSYGLAETLRWDRWAADNGAFPNGCDFERWKHWLPWLSPDDCLFAVAPDVPFDWAGTVDLFPAGAHIIEEIGYPLAIAAQDGATTRDVPWQSLACLFIGGTTDWKISDDARRLADEARARGLWVHMGRINTEQRFRLAASWDSVDSADGTFLKYGTKKNLHRLLRWLEVTESPQLALPRCS